MNRKNAFSYFIWFLYTLAVCGCLISAMGTISVKLGASRLIGAGCGFGWLLVAFLLTFVVHKLVKKQSGRTLGRIPAVVTEAVFVVLLLAVGIALRVVCIGHVAQESSYYEVAKVATGNQIPTVVHGATYLYVQLLHLVYWVFGNKFVAGIWLQIMLQLLCAGFLYGAVRKVAGVIPAVVLQGFFMLSPLMINEALFLSPEVLLLLIFSFGLYACSYCICGDGGHSVYLGAGMLISLVCYMDILGLALLLFTVAGIILGVEQTERPGKNRLISILLCLLGAGVGFMIWMLIDSLASGKALGGVMLAWWRVYLPTGYFELELNGQKPLAMEVIVLMLLMAIGIFSFWSNRKTERISLWTLTAITLLLLQCFGMTTEAVDGNELLFLVAAVLAGNGISAMFATESAAVGSIWMDGKLEARLAAMSQDVEEAIAVSEVVEPEEIPKVKLIENPLPLPKKHVKRILDFDMEPGEGMEEFDIPVSDDDDFDI